MYNFKKNIKINQTKDAVLFNLANLLAGDANFSGKMPFTYPKHINALANYDYKPCENMGQMGG
uniref:hypothetical protein n=1 Tax=Phocaeicola coprocola TaxID=310298 RepID=UPI00402759C0